MGRQLLHISLLALLFLMGFVSFSLATCQGGTADASLGAGEECDGGTGCQPDCTCGAGYVVATPPALSCDTIPCYNPVTSLGSESDSYITVNIASSLVDFHAYMRHQTNTSSGTALVTSVKFSAGNTSCDYPLNSYLALQTLNTATCYDDYSVSSTSFAGFTSCLSLVCTDNNGNPVNCTNASSCTVPPCVKTWSASVRVGRTYTLYNANGVSFESEVAEYHPLSIQFPWILSTTFNGAVWATPNVAGSAVITSVIYDEQSSIWTIAVSSALNWPYRLTKPVSTDSINGMIYTVSGCANVPNTTNACVQTISFNVSGCTGLSTIFGGTPATFNGLKYECYNQTDPDCPLVINETRNASITVVLDSNSPCGVVNEQVILVPSDLTFGLKQPDYVSARNSFIQGDIANFVVDITKNISEASIASVNVVKFEETAKNSGTSFSTTKVTTPTRCANNSTLCFTFNTANLANLPSVTTTTLTFQVTVDVEFTGISKKKRMVLQVANNRVRVFTRVAAIGVETEDSISGGFETVVSIIPFLILFASFFF